MPSGKPIHLNCNQNRLLKPMLEFARKIFLFLFLMSSLPLLGQDLIWPGDINNNGVADNKDVLYLGATLGLFGPERDSIYDFWEPQNVPSGWAPSFYPYFDFAFADCNGDGFISDEDLNAIIQNYGFEHGIIEEDSFDIFPSTVSQPILFAGEESILLNEGSTMSFPVTLGGTTNVVDEYYGIAFSLNFPPGFVVSAEFEFTDTTWFDAEGDGSLYLSRWDDEGNRLDIVHSKRNQTPALGTWGEIGIVHVVIEDDVPGFAGEIDFMTFDQTYLVNHVLQRQNTITIPLKAQGTTSLEELQKTSLDIYPHPVGAGKNCYILSEQINGQETLKLLDISGREIPVEASFESGRIDLQLPDVPPGVYILSIQSENKSLIHKLSIH